MCALVWTVSVDAALGWDIKGTLCQALCRKAEEALQIPSDWEGEIYVAAAPDGENFVVRFVPQTAAIEVNQCGV